MSKISNIEKQQRPREKALLEGVNVLSDKELLALIIRCGIKGMSAIEIADNILNEFGSLSKFLNLDMHSFMKIKGIKIAKAIELSAIIELAKRIGREESRKIRYIKDASDVYEMLKEQLENENQEYFVVLFLNVKLSVIKREVMFIGGESSSLIDINLIFKKAMLSGARKIICVHNHPSGDPTPSKEDVLLTQKIRDISEITNIELLDHVIIGKNDYVSFKKLGI